MAVRIIGLIDKNVETPKKSVETSKAVKSVEKKTVKKSADA